MSSGFLRYIEQDIHSQISDIIRVLKDKRDIFQKTDNKLQNKKSPITNESYENIFERIETTKTKIADTLINIENIKKDFNKVAEELDEFDKEIDKISANVNRHYLKFGLQSLARQKVKSRKITSSPIKSIIQREDTETPYTILPKGGYSSRRTKRIRVRIQ